MDFTNTDGLHDFYSKLLKNESEKPQILTDISNYFVKLSSFCTRNPPRNQDQLREIGFGKLTNLILLETLQNLHIKNSYLCLTKGITFISNFLTGNEKNQIHSWELFFPNFFVRSFSTIREDEVYLARKCMMLYNCSCKTPLYVEKISTSDDNLIVYLVDIMVANPKNEDLFLWSFYLLNKSLSYLPIYYPKLKEEMKEDQTIDLPSKRESTILKLFRSTIEEDSLIDPIEPQICEFLVELLINCFNFERQRTSNDELMEVIISVIFILSWCASQEDRPELKAVLIKKGLIHVSLKILERYPATPTPLKEFNMNKDKLEVPEQGMKSYLMKIIANLCYDNFECQELIRTEGGIPTILNHFIIDDNNPFLREWTILAIRNITQNNIENQNFISSLEIQDVPQSAQEEFKSMGFETRLVDGKLKFEKQTKK
jgi:hypothetical protein